MPKTESELKEKILEMEELWQFPFSWGAIDGCHIPIKCPPGGNESSKEYHNIKNIYSIVLMAVVGEKGIFLRGSCGFPDNSHYSINLQSTILWLELHDSKKHEDFLQNTNSAIIPPFLIGDSAIPLEDFLMKPYNSAMLSEEQRYFNYRLSRARMIVKSAFEQLTGRWRHLMYKSEGGLHERKIVTLACMILYNLCLDYGDTITTKLELAIDPMTGQRRDRQVLVDILIINSCKHVADSA